MSSNSGNSKLVEENLGISGSETVGVIVAIAGGATIVIIVILLVSMACRYWFSRRNRGSESILETDAISPTRNRVLKSPSSAQGTDHFRLKNETLTTNTFQSLPEPPAVNESTFSNQPPNGVTESVEKTNHPPHLEPQQFPRDDLMLQEKLGEGEYGPIYRGEAYGLGANDESKPVTVKMLAQLDGSRDMFNEDIEMLSSISHLNVVGLLAICTKDSPECALLDAGIPGDLLSYMQEKKKEVSAHIATESETNELLRIADEISLGMAYLSSERFIHKDLALRNCIIGLNGVVKIAHFGLGPLIYPEAYYRVNSTDLPIRWMSPEAITSASFTSMSDIWSFGVAMWELFTYGDLPFDGKNNEDVIDFVINEGRLKKPIKCSNTVFEIIMNCWNVDPHSRPIFLDLHENIADLAGIQSPLSALGPATPVSPLSPLTPTAMFGIGNDSGIPSTFKN